MSRAEERALKTYPYEGGIKGLICENDRKTYIRGFDDGYEQAEKDTIERACAWWERTLPYLTRNPEARETYLNDFKRAMEEENG